VPVEHPDDRIDADTAQGHAGIEQAFDFVRQFVDPAGPVHATEEKSKKPGPLSTSGQRMPSRTARMPTSHNRR
jgi:hypothetical protein